MILSYLGFEFEGIKIHIITATRLGFSVPIPTISSRNINYLSIRSANSWEKHTQNSSSVIF